MSNNNHLINKSQRSKHSSINDEFVLFNFNLIANWLARRQTNKKPLKS